MSSFPSWNWAAHLSFSLKIWFVRKKWLVPIISSSTLSLCSKLKIDNLFQLFFGVFFVAWLAIKRTFLIFSSLTSSLIFVLCLMSDLSLWIICVFSLVFLLVRLTWLETELLDSDALMEPTSLHGAHFPFETVGFGFFLSF